MNSVLCKDMENKLLVPEHQTLINESIKQLKSNYNC